MRHFAILAAVAIATSACGGARAPLTPVRVSSPGLEPGPPRRRPALVSEDGIVLAPFPDGPATLIGLAERCVGEVTDGRLEGCPLSRVRVALLGDAVATLIPPQSDDAPALEVDAPLHGRFAGHPLRFTIESPPGDALCPGSPTFVRFFNETLLGTVTLEAAITRQLGLGVAALLVTEDEVFVLLGWGRDSWRLVDVRGETVSEGQYAHDAECDCCE